MDFRGCEADGGIAGDVCDGGFVFGVCVVRQGLCCQTLLVEGRVRRERNQLMTDRREIHHGSQPVRWLAAGNAGQS